MNHITVSGNLVDKLRTSQNANGTLSAFGKIGVYNGKTKEGTQRDSMFFDIVVFGKTAETLIENTDKGSPVIVSGKLEEDKNISQTNGQTYFNKRIVCDDASLVAKPKAVQTATAGEVAYATPNQPVDPFGM